jgi:hypothetical protein
MGVYEKLESDRIMFLPMVNSSWHGQLIPTIRKLLVCLVQKSQEWRRLIERIDKDIMPVIPAYRSQVIGPEFNNPSTSSQHFQANQPAPRSPPFYPPNASIYDRVTIDARRQLENNPKTNFLCASDLLQESTSTGHPNTHANLHQRPDNAYNLLALSSATMNRLVFVPSSQMSDNSLEPQILDLNPAYVDSITYPRLNMNATSFGNTIDPTLLAINPDTLLNLNPATRLDRKHPVYVSAFGPSYKPSTLPVDLSNEPSDNHALEDDQGPSFIPHRSNSPSHVQTPPSRSVSPSLTPPPLAQQPTARRTFNSSGQHRSPTPILTEEEEEEEEDGKKKSGDEDDNPSPVALSYTSSDEEEVPNKKPSPVPSNPKTPSPVSSIIEKPSSNKNQRIMRDRPNPVTVPNIEEDSGDEGLEKDKVAEKKRGKKRKSMRKLGQKNQIGRISRAFRELNPGKSKGKDKQVDDIPQERMEVDNEEAPFRPVMTPPLFQASSSRSTTLHDRKTVSYYRKDVSAIVTPDSYTSSGFDHIEASHILTAVLRISDESRDALVALSQEELMDGFDDMTRKSLIKKRHMEHMKSPKHKRIRR